MKITKYILSITLIGFCFACNKNYIPEMDKEHYQSNNTISDSIEIEDDTTIGFLNINEIIGTWKITDFVYYMNEKDIKIVHNIPYSNNGKSLHFEQVDDSGDLLLVLKYANILSTICRFGESNSIDITNEWGGTELFDCTGNEEKIINLLNSVDKCLNIDNKLYLLDSKLDTNYNALCLQR